MNQEKGHQQLVTKNSIERASRDTFKRFLDNEYQAVSQASEDESKTADTGEPKSKRARPL